MAMILFDMRVRLAPDGKPEPDQLWLPVTPRNYGKISSCAVKAFLVTKRFTSLPRTHQARGVQYDDEHKELDHTISTSLLLDLSLQARGFRLLPGEHFQGAGEYTLSQPPFSKMSFPLRARGVQYMM
ncbi:hypothetical protein RRG08_059396 [Elysia crispata]|uniref:Uncharacterized protein n=1 Tax=Elysia crispata TaxID=231223 RepID=A0AAE1DWD4_9GAST|nr:hypothetical protein RRG08_059396 [Elysia crispata]